MGESYIGEDFSHDPETSNGEREVDLVSALRESVSFGRFMSEPLDWGKWSSFRHNRHLEEAGKHSAPGSVAQKKAYFEAHYKRIAAKKAAALQEQVSGTENSAPEIESNNVAVDDGNQIRSSEAEPEELSSEVAPNEVAEVEMPIIDADLLPSANESNLDEEKYRSENRDAEKGSPIIGEILVGSSLRNESTEIVEDVENQYIDTEVVRSRTSSLEKQPLKGSSFINQEFKDSAQKKPRVPISKSSVHRPSRLPPSYSSNTPLSPAANPISSMNFVKEIKPTPGSKKHEAVTNDRNKSNPKSLHMSFNIVEMVGDLKVASNSSKTSQNHLHPLRTPIKVSVNGLQKVASSTPQLEKGRTKTSPQQTVSGRRKAYEDLLSDRCSKSPSTKGTKARTQIVSSSPRFRTDERAEKRKEFFLNLEDKVDAKEAKKPPHVQRTSKMNKEVRKWHKRLHPYSTTLQELNDGRNAEQMRSRASVDHEATPIVQPLSSSPSPMAHDGPEGVQVKEPCSQFVGPSGLPTTGQPVPPGSSGQVRSVPASDRGQQKRTVSNNACMMREKPRRREDPYSIHKCIVAFNQMHGFTPEEMVKATKVFKDGSNREVFLSLKEDQRGFWLTAMFEEV